MNKVYLNNKLINNLDDLKQYKITLNGSNNIIKINDFEGNALIYVSIDGNNCEFLFGKGNIVRNDLNINFWSTADSKPNGSKIKIGDSNFFNGTNIIFISPLNTNIIVGNGNLFAGNISFWGRNDHVIYDVKKHVRRNIDRDILIGNNNWIGQNNCFLPGASIGNNSVVGYGSLINKKISKNNVIIAGAPARVKVKNINWSRASKMENVDFFDNIKINNNNE